MKTSLVIGLGFGDEGKGRTVSYLTSLNPDALVVRFNGGHQAGHTVVHKGNRHVCSSFGAGTLQGVPTLWSRYCTFYPTAVVNEYEILKTTARPQLFVDPLCPVTTPFDVDSNRAEESMKFHGSVGVGFGATIKRHESFYKLYFQDLYYDSILNAKLDYIMKNYYHITYLNDTMLEHKAQFLKDVETIRHYRWLRPANQLNINRFEQVIFEGAQGILLDMDFGFFPHVTRSNTTSKNAIALIKELGLPEPDIYYVTRAYQTRHGNGFMTNEDKVPKLVNNEHETNRSDGFQGKFRISMLDSELLNYALRCDNHFTKGMHKHLVMTCLDQRDPVYYGMYILLELDTDFKSMFGSYGAETTSMEVEWRA